MHLVGPSTTLQLSASDIEFDVRIAEAEAAANSDGKSDIHDDQTDKEHGYDTDIRLLVQPEIEALGV